MVDIDEMGDIERSPKALRFLEAAMGVYAVIAVILLFVGIRPESYTLQVIEGLLIVMGGASIVRHILEDTELVFLQFLEDFPRFMFFMKSGRGHEGLFCAEGDILEYAEMLRYLVWSRRMDEDENEEN